MDDKNFYSPIYSTYKDKGFVPELFLNALVTSIFSLISILVNLSVCYITLKYRKKYTALRSKTSILLVFYSFFEIMFNALTFVYLATSSTGINFLPSWLIKSYIFYCSMIFLNANLILFLISVDRLLGITFPIFYYNMKQKKYIIIQIIFMIIYDILIFTIVILPIYMKYDNIKVTGFPIDNMIIITTDCQITTLIPFLIYLFTLLNYLFVGILSKLTTDLNDETIKKLYRSLSLIVFVNIGSCFISYAEQLIVQVTELNIENQNKMNVKTWFILTYSSIIYIIGSASNAPILFINRLQRGLSKRI
ncbi:hypothetical protein ACQ4LE_000751 [Meloidogyne hapla]